jgi:DNA-binding NarL/FixJ family response regulator
MECKVLVVAGPWISMRPILDVTRPFDPPRWRSESGRSGDQSVEILVASAQPVLGKGIGVWIDGAPFAWHCAGVVDSYAALHEAFATKPIGMVVATPGVHDEALAVVASRADPKIRVFLLTGEIDATEEFDLVRCGAHGVISVDCTPERFTDTAFMVLSDYVSMSQAAMQELLHQPRRRASPRTRQVLELVCEGLPLPEIAETLDVTTRTVTSHINRGLRMEVDGCDDLIARTRLALHAPPKNMRHSARKSVHFAMDAPSFTGFGGTESPSRDI